MACWNLINHTELGSANATLIDVTSISSSYDHLCLLGSFRSDKSAYRTNAQLRFNNDSGSNYNVTHLYSGGSTPTSYRDTNDSSFDDIELPAASALTNGFGTFQMWIPYYANTANHKQAIILSTSPNTDGTAHRQGIKAAAGMWASTAAIDRITVFQSSDDFVQYSSITIYGINGAG
jgi:hypothetical protein